LSIIVGIPGAGHFRPGVDQERDLAARTRRWATCLAEGLGQEVGAIDLALAPYAHHLHGDSPFMQGTGGSDVEALTEDATSMLIHWLAALDLPPVTAHGRLTVPLRHALEMVAKRYDLDGRLTRLFVSVFFRELAAYLHDQPSSRRQAIHDEVATTIRTNRPRVLIAHSLGTVVAFETLHKHPDLGIHTLITLGSPLALQHAVFQRLSPGPVDGVAIRPPGIVRWINVSDHGDPVTIARPMKKFFPGIDLDVAESIGLFDFHHATNYLRCAAVAVAIEPFLRAQGGMPTDT
jgi:pimeloyl-ACP methyl ester carboxylesterase